MPTIPLDKLPLLADLLNRKLRNPRPAVRRDALGVVMGLHGLRNKECCESRWRVTVELKDGSTELRETIDPARKQIWVETIKGGRKAWVPATAFLLAWLAIHRARQRPPADYILATRTGRPMDPRNLRRRWKQWVVPIIGDYRFHDLRHTLARAIWENSHGNVLAVQKLLRHVNIQNTAIYLHTPEEVISWIPTAHFPLPLDLMESLKDSRSEPCVETCSSLSTEQGREANTLPPESSFKQQPKPSKKKTAKTTKKNSAKKTYNKSKPKSETSDAETDSLNLKIIPLDLD